MSVPTPPQDGAPIIKSARITEMPKSLFDPMPKVIVTDSNGAETTLFEYYPDEISFTESEFIGLTLEQGRRLKFEKDRNYLRS
jgi:hypothetical protein